MTGSLVPKETTPGRKADTAARGFRQGGQGFAVESSQRAHHMPDERPGGDDVDLRDANDRSRVDVQPGGTRPGRRPGGARPSPGPPPGASPAVGARPAAEMGARRRRHGRPRAGHAAADVPEAQRVRGARPGCAAGLPAPGRAQSCPQRVAQERPPAGGDRPRRARSGRRAVATRSRHRQRGGRPVRARPGGAHARRT